MNDREQGDEGAGYPRGRDDTALRTYQVIREVGPTTRTVLGKQPGVDGAALDATLSELSSLGLVTTYRRDPHDEPELVAVGPEVAALRLIESKRQQVRQWRQQEELFYGTFEAIASTFATQRGRAGIEVVSGRARTEQLRAELALLARREVLAIHPGAAPDSETLARGLQWAQRLAARGLRQRHLYVHATTATPRGRQYLANLSRLEVEIRYAPTLPSYLVVVDRQVALLAANPGDDCQRQPSLRVIRDEAASRWCAETFEYCWSNATEAFRPRIAATAPAALDETQAAILRLMAAGIKDDGITRKLGISRRTTSRLVGEVMKILQAENRFQAGVRAVELGLLTTNEDVRAAERPQVKMSMVG